MKQDYTDPLEILEPASVMDPSSSIDRKSSASNPSSVQGKSKEISTTEKILPQSEDEVVEKKNPTPPRFDSRGASQCSMGSFTMKGDELLAYASPKSTTYRSAFVSKRSQMPSSCPSIVFSDFCVAPNSSGSGNLPENETPIAEPSRPDSLNMIFADRVQAGISPQASFDTESIMRELFRISSNSAPELPVAIRGQGSATEPYQRADLEVSDQTRGSECFQYPFQAAEFLFKPMEATPNQTDNVDESIKTTDVPIPDDADDMNICPDLSHHTSYSSASSEVPTAAIQEIQKAMGVCGLQVSAATAAEEAQAQCYSTASSNATTSTSTGHFSELEKILETIIFNQTTTKRKHVVHPQPHSSLTEPCVGVGDNQSTQSKVVLPENHCTDALTSTEMMPSESCSVYDVCGDALMRADPVVVSSPDRGNEVSDAGYECVTSHMQIFPPREDP